MFDRWIASLCIQKKKTSGWPSPSLPSVPTHWWIPLKHKKQCHTVACWHFDPFIWSKVGSGCKKLEFFFFALGKSTEQKWLSLVHFVLHPATRPPCDPCRLLQSHKNEKRRPEGGLKVSLPKRHTKCLLCNADTNISVVLTLPSAATVQTLYVQSVVVCRKSQPSVALSNLKTDCPSMLFLFMHDVSHGKSQRI